ncbi:MAG: preprotein translocase subunit SecG [Bacteroidota bacterium]|nr:preprotein translocase subunit SecG [Bacteroidota bacterium]MDP4214907.1 preprotein translocase subunit SecG [Bacteroidota bacterium]MDP4246358.1 preprotein translocase subunit SecG [Bacteroidota bacterium]MDP4254367.1 preprotein translocase subunit SecG [Bacteroidota bacterium]MDP4258834.1 preprotein translocase subunit SecG [Bacteroidota bacterium]
MTFLFVLLIIVASVFLGLIILIQNPKGGGLASNVGGFSNQLMGVKQTTDVLEKGTWILAVVVGLLCLFSAVFIPKSSTAKDTLPQNVSAPASSQQQQPGTVPFGGAAPAKKQ